MTAGSSPSITAAVRIPRGSAATAEQPLRPVIDELGYDMVDMPGVSVEETVFEPLDHN